MAFVGKTGLIVSAGMLLAGVILLSIGAANGGVEQVQAMVQSGELSVGRGVYQSPQTEWISKDNLLQTFAEADVLVEGGQGLIHEITYNEACYEIEDDGIMEIAKKDEIKKLEIDWDASINGLLSIITIDEDYFLITDESLTYEVNGDTIKFSQKNNFQYMTDDTTLYVPSSWVGKEIELSIGAGSVYADILQAEKIRIEVGAGHMQCEQLKSEELDVEIGAGYFELYDFQTKNVKCEIGIGNATMYNGTITGNLSAQCGIGSLFMELMGKETDHNYKISSVGSLTIGSVIRSGLGNNYEVNNYADSNFDVECGLGTIEIYFTEYYEQDRNDK